VAYCSSSSFVLSSSLVANSLADHGVVSTDSDQIGTVWPLAQAGWIWSAADPILGESQVIRAMLTGSELISKVTELQQQNATRTDIVIGCGYVKPDGKAAYVAFYEALIEAKQPQWQKQKEETETHLEFDDEEQEEEFLKLCEFYPQQALEIYYDNIGNFDQFEQAYQGEYDSEAHFTEEMVAIFSNTQIPSWIVIDYQATATNFDYWEEDNFFFLNMWSFRESNLPFFIIFYYYYFKAGWLWLTYRHRPS